MWPDCRSWDDAYEQLTYERGACNLVQKYSPQLVRNRVFSEPNATWTIMVGRASAQLWLQNLHHIAYEVQRSPASCAPRTMQAACLGGIDAKLQV